MLLPAFARLAYGFGLTRLDGVRTATSAFKLRINFVLNRVSIALVKDF